MPYSRKFTDPLPHGIKPMMSELTPMQLAAFQFVADRRVDRVTRRHRTVDLRKISEPMRRRIIDLAMMDPPLVDVDADQVFLTGHGYVRMAELRAPRQTETGHSTG